METVRQFLPRWNAEAVVFWGPNTHVEIALLFEEVRRKFTRHLVWINTLQSIWISSKNYLVILNGKLTIWQYFLSNKWSLHEYLFSFCNDLLLDLNIFRKFIGYRLFLQKDIWNRFLRKQRKICIKSLHVSKSFFPLAYLQLEIFIYLLIDQQWKRFDKNQL